MENMGPEMDFLWVVVVEIFAESGNPRADGMGTYLFGCNNKVTMGLTSGIKP